MEAAGAPVIDRPDERLAGKRILLVDPDRFSITYVAALLIASGAHVVGPFARLEEAGEHVADGATLDFAVIGSGALEPTGWTMLAMLHRWSIPTLFLRGEEEDWLDLFRHARWLDRPFAAHQVAECLANALRHPR